MSRLTTISHLGEHSKLTIGSRLREVRKVLKLNGEAFAKAIGTSQASLSLYENGKSAVPIRIVICVGEDFEVDTNWLLLGRTRMFVATQKARMS